MDWFLYGRDLRHERVEHLLILHIFSMENNAMNFLRISTSIFTWERIFEFINFFISLEKLGAYNAFHRYFWVAGPLFGKNIFFWILCVLKSPYLSIKFPKIISLWIIIFAFIVAIFDNHFDLLFQIQKK